MLARRGADRCRRNGAGLALLEPGEFQLAVDQPEIAITPEQPGCILLFAGHGDGGDDSSRVTEARPAWSGPISLSSAR